MLAEGSPPGQGSGQIPSFHGKRATNRTSRPGASRFAPPLFHGNPSRPPTLATPAPSLGNAPANRTSRAAPLASPPRCFTGNHQVAGRPAPSLFHGKPSPPPS